MSTRQIHNCNLYDLYLFKCVPLSCSDITDFFMGLALLTAKRSMDPSTQVGACIVRDDNKVIGCGHNLMPEGKNNKYTWAREGDDTKYLYGNMCIWIYVMTCNCTLQA
uniref:dCMP deaminase n=1 Tax=Neogobius melanostomus TaxID=47308 RepID=A0A8C6WVR2_9GOBI